MPKPSTVRDLVDVIRRSRLIDEGKLHDYLTKIQVTDESGGNPVDLLTKMTEDHILTRFQAEQLGVGKWRGFVIGNYRLLDQVGGGGMGQVFLGEHMKMKRKVAIKVLSNKLIDDPTALERFGREARAAAVVRHPNIVEVIDIDTSANPPYMVMEYIDGITLQAAVARYGTFDVGVAAYCAMQVASGLHGVHLAGLVHRDIKPANLMLDRRGTVKILDLGIVRIDTEAALTVNMSQNLILGTADYLSPEQAVNSHGVDTRTDVYALGCTLYFMLVGHPPFPSGSPQLKLLKKQMSDPTPVENLRKDIPLALAEVVKRMLARAPTDRYDTPGDAADALSAFAAVGPTFPSSFFGPPKPLPEQQSWGATPTGPSSAGTSPSSEFPRPPELGSSGSGNLYKDFVPGSSSSVIGRPDERHEYSPTSPDQLQAELDLALREASSSSSSTQKNSRTAQKAPIGVMMALLVGGAAVLMAVVVAILLWPKSPQTVATAPTPKVVTEHPVDNGPIAVAHSGLSTYRTISEALGLVRGGGKIEIQEAAWEERLHFPAGKIIPGNVTIGGASSLNPVVWKMPDDADPAEPLFAVPPGSRVILENIVFDGKNRAERAITVSGGNVQFRNVVFRGFTKRALTLEGATAATVERCRFLTEEKAEFAVRIAPESRGGAAPTELIEFRQCRFEGPFHAAIRCESGRKLNVTQCRFYRGAMALSVLPPRGSAVAMPLTRNVFSEVGTALFFEEMPEAIPGGISFQGNLFDDVKVPAQLRGETSGADASSPLIWNEALEASALAPSKTVCFRAEFEMPKKWDGKSRIWLEMMVDYRLSLWINGQWVPAGVGGTLVDRFSVSEYLTPGKNAIAVRVETRPGEWGRPGFLLALRQEGTATAFFDSSASWKASVGETAQWNGATFDDSDWPLAVRLKNPHTRTEGAVRVSILERRFPGCRERFQTESNLDVVGGCRSSFPPVELWVRPLKLPKEPGDDSRFLRHHESQLPESERGKFGLPAD